MQDDTLMASYEEVPYPDLCYTQTHPDRLATLATLLGLRPAPVSRCRVLELGCASGGNLIPMAYGLPDSRFVGVDFSAVQIKQGQQTIESLNLDNIELRREDILDFPADLGKFDYIIAHGVYSWVPPAVRDKLMEVCGRHLAADGVAYISYNTHPGWHMLGALRDMMLYHSRKADEPSQRVDQALSLLDFLARSIPPEEDPYGTFLNAYSSMIKAYHRFVTQEREKEEAGRELLLHDELEAVNDPVYFHEFAAHAAEHGLQYLVEADFARVVPTNLPPEVTQELMAMSGDIIEVEQYMDFLRNRTLRQTLLCHEDIAIQRTLQADPAQLGNLFVATYARPVPLEGDPEGEDVTSGEVIRDDRIIQFRGPDGALLAIDHPVSKAAMFILSQISPQALTFGDLLRQAIRGVYGDSPGETSNDAAALAANILRAYSYSARLVELHVHNPAFAAEPGTRPLASALAHLQLENGNQRVANLRHERVKLEGVSLRLLPYLDGEHSQAELRNLLIDQVARGDITLEHDGEPITDDNLIRSIMSRELDMSLRWLARAALLHQ